MAIIPILQYPDPRLHNKATIVKDVTAPMLQKIIHDMVETLHNTPNCAALAASQLDIKNPPCITVINQSPGNRNEDPLCLINPEILTMSGEMLNSEGCMSICPNQLSAYVKRAKNIQVQALNRKGEVITLDADGYLAQCLQHEIDHLNGILYLDRLSALKRERIEKKMVRLINKNSGN